MLDAFIIEEIKRRDHERTADDRPAVELPIPLPPEPTRQEDDKPGAPNRDRGVVIIDYTG